MEYPADVTLATIRVGSVVDFFGTAATVSVEVTPILGGKVTHLVHAATGVVMVPTSKSFGQDAEGEAIFQVPYTDLPGWLGPGGQDASGGWGYEVKVTARLASGKALTWQKNIAPVRAQTEPIDFDLVPDEGAIEEIHGDVPVVLSVNGKTGHVTVTGGTGDGTVASDYQLTIGTVTDGETASATITDADGDGINELNLVLRRGEQGPPGQDGADGNDGADGADAYEVALAAGFTGSRSEWLASLKGEPGQDGADGADGADGTGITISGSVATATALPAEGNEPGDAYVASDTGLLHIWDGSQWGAGVQFKGDKGDKGDKGEPGDDGADGASAYQLAVAAGFSGTEAQWRASLKGDKGDKGDPGADGADGADGSNGQGVPAGGSTGQILAKAGNTSYNTHWVPANDHQHDIADVADLSSTLASKLDATKVWDGTAAEYDAVPTYDPNTTYYIYEG